MTSIVFFLFIMLNSIIKYIQFYTLRFHVESYHYKLNGKISKRMLANAIFLLARQQKKTGGGSLSKKERRIVESPLYADIVHRMGPSASGNKPRFDNDQTDSIPSVPSKRLRNVLSIDDDNSLQSNSVRAL